MILENKTNYHDIVENLREYNLKKNIKAQLKIINPLLSNRANDIKAHMNNALNSGIISKSESEFLDIKIMLGRMILELEQVLDDIYVSILFYDSERNTIYHGACPSVPPDFFDFFKLINEQGLFDENCGPCGKAVFKQEIVQTDIETSPLWSKFKVYPLKVGFKSCTSIPFYTSTGRLAGTFANYSKDPNHTFTPDELAMIQEKIYMYRDEIQSISDRLNEHTQSGHTALSI
ncbi:GAF domain-containing protein [Planococcus sp. X10-3]|uniref:GAF domain-containing protein n=1 Tax=Planococcus sp. X10-3 TaxID=3061240 RepID=UPI003BB09476